MIRITKAETKALLKLFPNAKIIIARHHNYLGGYETDKPFAFIMEQRGFKPKKRHPPKKKTQR